MAAAKSIAKQRPRPIGPVTNHALALVIAGAAPLALVIARVFQQGAVDQPLDRRAVVGVDLAAVQPRRQLRGGVAGERAQLRRQRRRAAGAGGPRRAARPRTSSVLVGSIG